MNGPRRVRVGETGKLRESSGKCILAGHLDVAVFKRGGMFFAVNNVCAHQHFSLLHKGALEGTNVTCPMHGWTYDMRTGRATTGEGAVARYETTVENGVVFVSIPDEE